MLEAPQSVYKFLREEIGDQPDNICSKFKNKTVEINLTVKDTSIVEGTGKIYAFAQMNS